MDHDSCLLELKRTFSVPPFLEPLTAGPSLSDALTFSLPPEAPERVSLAAFKTCPFVDSTFLLLLVLPLIGVKE